MEQALETIQSLLDQNLIDKTDLENIQALLETEQITPEEISTAYAPFIEGTRRHI